MTNASPARDKDHRRRTELSHEQGIVIGAADHFFGRQIKLVTNFKNCAGQGRITKGGLVHIEALDLKTDPTAPTNLRHDFFDTPQGGIAAAQSRVAQINFQTGAARNTIDRAWLDP